MTSRAWVTAMVVGAVGLVLGLGIGALAWMEGDHASMSMGGTTMHSSGDMSAQDTSLSSGAMDERAFIEMMVPHHQSAVAMAELALKKASHPEVKQLARDIIRSQDQEIVRMEAWYKQWYGKERSPGTSQMDGMTMTGPGMDGMGMSGADMSALETATRADFDRMFLAMMIPHHAGAVMMATEVKAGDPRPEIADLADRIIAAQSTEIGQMQSWRERWYPPLG